MNDLNEYYAIIGRIAVEMEAVSHLQLALLLDNEEDGSVDKARAEQLIRASIAERNNAFLEYLKGLPIEQDRLTASIRWAQNLSALNSKRSDYVHSVYVRRFADGKWLPQRFPFNKYNKQRIQRLLRKSFDQRKGFDLFAEPGLPLKIEEFKKVERQIVELLFAFQGVVEELGTAEASLLRTVTEDSPLRGHE